MEDNLERVSRYINGLRFEIQYEMNLLCPSSIEEAYPFSLKAKEKLARKSQAKSRGTFRGRGPMRGRGNLVEANSSSSMEHITWLSEDKGRRPSTKSRGGGRGFQVKCFKCGHIGYKSFECPENAVG